MTAPGRATPVALVAYRESGGRDFWFSVHDSAAMDLDAGTAERLADRADWLHVSGSTLGFGGGPARAIEAAAARVLERGGRLSLDPNVRTSADERLRESVARLARSAHVLFPSEGELATLDLDPRELAGRGVVVCETRGRDGALLFDPEPVHVPVVPVDEVDPTGAGDTFAAAFVTALRAGDTALGGRGVRVPDGGGLRRRARRDGGAGGAVSGGLVLGIDIGTSSIKAAVFDTDGRDVAHSREPTPWRIVDTGAELDPGALLASTLKAVREALAAPLRVAAIGVASMAETGVLLDGSGRRWSRRSPGMTAAGPPRRQTSPRASARMPSPPASVCRRPPTCTLVKYRWMRGNWPAAARGVRWLNVAEWIVLGLGGDPAPELSLASRTGFYDLHARRPWPEALAWADAPPGLAAEPVARRHAHGPRERRARARAC